jgi:hypothetical protein
LISPHKKKAFPETVKNGLSPIQLKRKFLFFLKSIFSVGSANTENLLLPSGPLPGQKSIRLAQKGGDSSFLDAGFRRFSTAIPWPPRLFAETKKGDR